MAIMEITLTIQNFSLLCFSACHCKPPHIRSAPRLLGSPFRFGLFTGNTRRFIAALVTLAFLIILRIRGIGVKRPDAFLHVTVYEKKKAQRAHRLQLQSKDTIILSIAIYAGALFI
jgi:hypothetical protein